MMERVLCSDVELAKGGDDHLGRLVLSLTEPIPEAWCGLESAQVCGGSFRYSIYTIHEQFLQSGEIQYSLQIKQLSDVEREFTLNIHAARDLMICDASGFSDPYVVIELVPSRCQGGDKVNF